MTRYLDYKIGQPCRIPRGGAATIGVFDGIHIGHQAILRRLVARARRLEGPATLLTFATHPRQIVGGQAPKQLISLEQRLRLIEAHGVDSILVLAFDDEVRRMEAEPFARSVFRETLGVDLLVIGHDTALGRDRRGDAAFLGTLGATLGFEVEVVAPVLQGGKPISSTRIREALLDGNLPEAQAMLGRPVTLLGDVVAGDARGREIGIPTANIELHQAAYPRTGVYAVRVGINGGIQGWPAVCNIGCRPTFEASPGMTIELHLLDFSGDLYGRELTVEFISRIRDEHGFASADELVAQIGRDIEAARQILSTRS